MDAEERPYASRYLNMAKSIVAECMLMLYYMYAKKLQDFSWWLPV
jgi:hypothetical protein